MTKEETDVKQWLRNKTLIWNLPPPTHCLSHHYYKFSHEIIGMPPIPLFIEKSDLNSIGAWQILALEIQHDFARKINDNKIDVRYDRLVNLKEDLWEKAEQLVPCQR